MPFANHSIFPSAIINQKPINGQPNTDMKQLVRGRGGSEKDKRTIIWNIMAN